MFLHYATIAVGAAIKAVSAYFAGVSLFALRRQRPYPDAAPATRFAVVIPARNEAGAVGRLVESLLDQEYPRTLYEIYVVPNNCTDDTEGAALAAGARVLRCAGSVRNKGDALRESLAVLMDDPAGYDAFLVFDADNLADRRFLTEMDRAFQAGARVAKARNEAKNPYDSWISGCYSIYFGIFAAVFNRARAACGLSAKLVGTGFAVRREVLEKLGGWRTRTITEDADFAAQLALEGERVRWVPRAVAYDEEPLTLLESMKQRKRWCSGIMQVARLRFPDFLRRGGRGFRALKLDAAMFLTAPFLQAVSVFDTFLVWALAFAGSGADPSALALTALLGGAATYIGTAGLAALIAFRYARFDRRILKSVLGFPIFMLSWIPLQVLALFRKTVVWEEIRHTRSLSIAEAAARVAGGGA
ncbi:MAG: glycosyltransferase family 2 protein [Clostridia bacterium]|nr:glycosyltransferase family 2 protein [Clostridia bacterium]